LYYDIYQGMKYVLSRQKDKKKEIEEKIKEN
jgi:hypothetical protein